MNVTQFGTAAARNGANLGTTVNFLPGERERERER
jgi:hypothetical protein